MVHPSERIRGSVSDDLAGKRIVLGVAGSIAAVKTVELARALIRHGADVVPVMTPAATRIIHPDALQFATGHKPLTALSGAVEHVAEFGEQGDADLLLVAPATANTVAKLALGIDDTALTTFASVALGNRRPVLLAPAMHAPMEENPPTQEHLQALRDRGVRIVRPLYEEGKAKLAPVDDIVDEVRRALGSGLLDGQRVLVVTGASTEPLDPVRVVTNRSTGRMGHALARVAHQMGAEVAVWSGSGDTRWPPGVAVSSFDGVEDLLARIDADDATYDLVLVPAALSDFAPVASQSKISSDADTFGVELRRLPKVLPRLRSRHPDARIIGWKLQDDLDAAIERARARLADHDIHAMVANATDSLGSDRLRGALVTHEEVHPLEGTKEQVAAALLRTLAGGKSP